MNKEKKWIKEYKKKRKEKYGKYIGYVIKKINSRYGVINMPLLLFSKNKEYEDGFIYCFYLYAIHFPLDMLEKCVVEKDIIKEESIKDIVNLYEKKHKKKNYKIVENIVREDEEMKIKNIKNKRDERIREKMEDFFKKEV